MVAVVLGQLQGEMAIHHGLCTYDLPFVAKEDWNTVKGVV